MILNKQLNPVAVFEDSAFMPLAIESATTTDIIPGPQ